MKSLIYYKGDTYEVDEGTTVEQVFENMKQLFPSIADSSISTSSSNGQTIFTIKDRPGEKG